MVKVDVKNGTINWPTAIVIILFTFLANLGSASDLVCNFKKYDQKDGLSHFNAYALCQDQQGFIWVGTKSGLNRFDGYSFQPFYKETHGLSSNEINHILMDESGLLWLIHEMVTRKEQFVISIDLFNPITYESISFPDYFGEDLPFDPRSIKLIKALENNVLFFLETTGRTWTYQVASGFAEFVIPKGYELIPLVREKQIWARKGETLTLFTSSGKALQSFSFPKSHDIFSITLDSWNRPWVNYLSQNKKESGFAILNEQAPFKKVDPFFLLNNQIYSRRIIVNHNWLDSTTLFTSPYLTILDGQQNIIFQEKRKEWRTYNVQDFLIDHQNTMWLATISGIYSVHAKKSLFQKYLNTNRDLLKPDVWPCRSMFEHEGTLFISTENGFLLLDLSTGEYTPLSKFSGQRQKGAIHTMKKGKKGSIWMGNNRLWEVNKDSIGLFRLYAMPQDHGRIVSLYQDTTNRWWLGMAFGLLYYEEGKPDSIHEFQKYNEFTALQKSQIEYIYQEKDTLWLASNRGLYQMELSKGIIAHYWPQGQGRHHLPTNHVRHLTTDQKGVFWIATADAGMIKWDRKQNTWEQVSRQNGLRSNDIYAVYEDDFNHLWLSSENGLIQIDKANLNPIIYLEEDGLPHNEFNRYSHYQNEEGQLYFGGRNGIIRFHPKDMYGKRTTYDGQLNVSEIQIFNGEKGIFRESLPLFRKDGKIVLEPSDDYFTLKPVLQDYYFSESASYAYRIKGYLKDWTDLKASVIHIGGIPYGRYTLEVRAHRGDGRLSSHILRIPIEIQRPFYLTWWFLLSCIAVAMLIIWQFYQWRTAQLIIDKQELEGIVQSRTLEIQKDKQIIEQQAQELKQIDEVKSRFFTNISHELRTPVTLIATPIEHLMQKHVPKLDDEVKRSLQIVRSNAKKLLNLIEELLELSRLDAGKRQLNQTPTHLYSFCRQLFSAYESAARIKNIKYEFHYELEESQQFFIDKKRLEKIVNNLLSNALKFTSKKGEVTLWVMNNKTITNLTHHQSLIVNSPSSIITIQVTDTGRGIPPKDLPHVFDRYFQTKRKNIPVEGGTGIGLALAKELAELMGGTLKVESQLNSGSTFTLQFPSSVVEVPEKEDISPVKNAEIPLLQPTPVSATQDTPQQKILIVEDNPDMQQLLLSLLLEDYECILANNGDEAWELLNKDHPSIKNLSLILSDIMMPQMDGYDLLDHIKKHKTWQKIPIIMLTARAAEEDKLQALRMGVDDYLIKPFSANELRARITNLIANYQARSSFIAANPEVISLELEEKESADHIWLKKLEDYILYALGKKLEISTLQLADEMAISNRQMLRRLKALTGLSIKKYVQEVKLQKARHMLENREVNTISEVAYACGFNTPGYFTQVYESRFGKRPGEYLQVYPKS